MGISHVLKTLLAAKLYSRAGPEKSVGGRVKRAPCCGKPHSLVSTTTASNLETEEFWKEEVKGGLKGLPEVPHVGPSWLCGPLTSGLHISVRKTRCLLSSETDTPSRAVGAAWRESAFRGDNHYTAAGSPWLCLVRGPSAWVEGPQPWPFPVLRTSASSLSRLAAI